MNIAIVVRKLTVSGGTQRQALSLARELLDTGHRVSVFTMNYDPARCFPDMEKKFPIISLEYQYKTRWFPLRFIEDIFSAFLLARKIPRDVDILQPHDQVAYRVAGWYRFFHPRTPSLWMMNDMPTRIASYERDRENGAQKPSFFVWLLWNIFDQIDIQMFIWRQSHVVTLDERDASWVKRYYRLPVSVVRSGVPDEYLRDPVLPRSIAGNTFQILSVGIFLPHRRYETLIEAVRLLISGGVPVHATIVGSSADKSYRKKIDELIVSAGVSSYVTIQETVSDDELRGLYDNSHLFVFIPHLQSWGLAPFEAIGRGLPVILSKTAGASEVLLHEEHVLHVDPHDASALSSLVKNAIADYPSMIDRARRAREYVSTHFSWRRYAEEMLVLAKSLLN